jgi:hypothetical protein
MRDTLAIQQHLDLMLLAQAFDLLIAIAGQANLNFILGVLRKRVGNRRATTSPQRQSFDVFFLREVGPQADCVRRRRDASVPTASRLIFCAAEI